MTRSVFVAALFLAVPAFAADQRADDHMIDAQKDLNQGKRKAANDELKAEKVRSGDSDLTSMDSELRNKLGDNWTVKKSGTGWLATRVEHKKADPKLTQKIGEQMRDYRDHNQDAQVSRKSDEVMLRGRIDDCGDVAKAANDFAGIDGVNRIFVDVSCNPNQ